MIDPTDPRFDGILEITVRTVHRIKLFATSRFCLEKGDDTYKLKGDMTIITKSSASSTVQTESGVILY